MSYDLGMRAYTTVQAAKQLGVGRDTLYRWMKSGKIKGGRAVRVGGSADVQLRLWTEGDLARIRRWMKANPYKSRGRKLKR
jgi:excisionase family DNA binding protein